MSEKSKKIPFPKNTLFLVPPSDYDRRIVELYLRTKYEDVDRLFVQSSFNMQLITNLQSGAIVTVTVRAPEHELVLAYRVRKDDQGIRYDDPIEPDTYLKWVRESEPVQISEYAKVSPANIFQAYKPDLNPLLDKLNEGFFPYRLQPQNYPDVLCKVMPAI